MNGAPTPGTVAALLAAAAARLAAASGSARLDAEVLLSSVLGCARSRLAAWPGAAVDATAARRFDELVARRAAGEPVAYLTESRDFWTLSLTVDARVLVPRPETELLVELALGVLPRNASVRLLDLGTGSGAVALALASERAQWRVAAVDRSAGALAVARANATRLGIDNVEFLEGSWFGPLGARRFDAIVANPPYLAADDAHLRDDGLRFEPRAALVAGPTGLEDLEAIIGAAPRHLEDAAPLMLEHGVTQGEAVRGLLVRAGFVAVRTQCDLSGLPRVSLGVRPAGTTRIAKRATLRQPVPDP